tara:strand:- start:1398 stop:1571 length:174 start_codon:yes stop_codon:yes gene_type:complete
VRGRVLLWGQYIGYVLERGYDVNAVGTKAVSRFLVQWRHPEDGAQKTWVDRIEIRPW